jgi:hypothetical protein
VGPDGKNFLKDNQMTMQYGAVTYTPYQSNGNWTQLCQIAAQARSVGYGASRKASNGNEYPNHDFLRKLWGGQIAVPNIGTLYNNTQTTYPSAFMNKPASYQSGTKYFDSASAWYPSLQQGGVSGTKNTDFLTNYFMSAMQAYAGSTGSPPVPQFSSALSGTNDIDANIQIFEKSSTYFVATTHAMYYLELAEEALKKNNTAAAKNHFDSIAAVYFGCGDTNPVPLPIYPPDTVVTTSPQEATQILWTKDSDEEDGEIGTLYSMYNLANKRASNYGKCGASKTGTCTTTKSAPKSKATTVTVADLNLDVSAALNYGTSGPTSAAVSTIRDSINTINAQAAQRYIARVSLDAQLPGNGMGGSTKRVTPDIPTGLTANAMPTACGAQAYVTPGQGVYATSPTTLGNKVDGTIFAAKTPNVAMAIASQYGTSTLVNAPCGTTANSTGTVQSNTATMESVMNNIEIGAADKLPYIRVGTGVPTAGGRTACTPPTGLSKNYGTEGSVGVSTQKIIAATRGEDAYSATTDYSKKTPIGCIGPNVFFSDVVIPTGTGNAELANMIYSFCDPTGMKGVAKSEYNLNQNLFLYANSAGTASTVAPATNTYFQTVTGITDATAKTTAAITKAQCGVIQHVWDPIMAAQLTQGAFCCNAEYYGPDGLGRAQPYYQIGNTGAVANQGIALPPGVVAPTGTGLLSAFNPPLIGGDMSAETSPGNMCPAHGSGNGYTEKTYSAIFTMDSPPMKELLEGQAFYAALAPSQYSLPTTSTTAATQTARAKKQKKCAEHITSMMKLNKKAASVGAFVTDPADNTATETSATGSGTTSAAETVWDYAYSSINFPLWKVALGSGSPAAKYTVPSGYCYANACFDDFAKVGTQSTFKGTQKLGELVSGPNMAAPKDASTACGHANSACAAAPATWDGGPAVMQKCFSASCSAGGILDTTGALPVA